MHAWQWHIGNGIPACIMCCLNESSALQRGGDIGSDIASVPSSFLAAGTSYKALG